MKSFRRTRDFVLVLAAIGALLTGAGNSLFGACGPFTDFTDATFCPFVLEIFTLGITTGTTPTTYDPSASVSRLQMAAFLSRTVDRTLKRGSRRAALERFWTTQNANVLGVTTVGTPAYHVKFDGADLWVTAGDGSVSRVRASDARKLEAWTSTGQPVDLLVAMNRIIVLGGGSSGRLYRIDPSQPAGAMATVASLPEFPAGIAFDGARVWATNFGSVTIVTPGASIPWTASTVSSGFETPNGAIYDGANVWITDSDGGRLLKLDSGGGILQTVTVGTFPQFPLFDGSNIWVPNGGSNTVSVVRASNGTLLQTLTGNGLVGPRQAAFDGERVLVVGDGMNVSLWKAADLTPLGAFPAPAQQAGVCSDGIGFWITLNTSPGTLAHF